MATLDEITVQPREAAEPPRSVPAPLTAAAADPMDLSGANKPPFKSWRKKYRKMRMRFDERMRESNTLFREEHKAVALARRLQEQNDQLLDLLLDINETAKVPVHLRYDLRSPSPSSSAVPSLEADEENDHEVIQQKLQDARNDLANGIITPEEFAQRELKLTSKLTAASIKSFASLLKVPHTRTPPDPVPDDLEITGDNPPGYLSPDHEEEYLQALDNALNDPASYDPSDTSGRPIRLAARDVPSEKELQIRNPDSVYNWLRKYQPQVFLQDKENDKETGGETKGSGKGSGNGRGKKGAASAATPSRMDEDEDVSFVAETGNARGKRSKDDEPYRPKGGSSRSTKRKREDGEGKGGRKKIPKSSLGGPAA